MNFIRALVISLALSLTSTLIYTKIGSTFAETLQAEFSDTRLPTPRFLSQSIFDGAQSIYIFGGYDSNNKPALGILRYDVYSESIEEVAQLPTVGFGGSIQIVGSNIYYIGICGSSVGCYNIMKFDIQTQDIYLIFGGITLNQNILTSFKQHGSPVVYLFYDLIVQAFDTLSETLVKVDGLFQYWGLSSAVLGQYSYNFGSTYSTGIRSVLKLDSGSPKFNESELISANTPKYGTFYFASSDGVNVYIFGDNNPNVGSRLDYVLQFSPATYSWLHINITNFPASKYYTNYASGTPPNSVFVGSLNRIYYIGGQRSNITSTTELFYDDDIWYLSLGPIPISTTTTPSENTSTIASIFSCEDLDNGIYPHPKDTSRFIWCRYGAAIEIDCPCKI